jgi:hypothetical protein
VTLLNYTSTVSVQKSITQITARLVKAGARGVVQEFDAAGNLTGLEFAVPFGDGMLRYRLPCDPTAVRTVLQRQHVRSQYLQWDHVERVAWRILHDWIAAQLALIETQMVTLPQVMLAYCVDQDGVTVYDRFLSTQRALVRGEQP